MMNKKFVAAVVAMGVAGAGAGAGVAFAPVAAAESVRPVAEVLADVEAGTPISIQERWAYAAEIQAAKWEGYDPAVIWTEYPGQLAEKWKKPALRTEEEVLKAVQNGAPITTQEKWKYAKEIQADKWNSFPSNTADKWKNFPNETTKKWKDFFGVRPDAGNASADSESADSPSAKK